MDDIPVRQIQTKSEPNLPAGFGIRPIDELLRDNDLEETLHRHDFFYMLALLKGKGSHTIDFTGYEIADRTIFLMRPGQVHQLSLKAGASGYLLQFYGDFFPARNASAKDSLRNAIHAKICIPDQTGFDKLNAILEYIHKEFTQKAHGFEEVIKANLKIFFIELVRHRQNSARTATPDTYRQQKLEKFFDLLDSGVIAHKNASHYADKLNLSGYQLGAITKSLLGKTPSELINERILLEARRELLATGKQVNQIAYQLGYEDVSYFIRFFKKHTGHSPETFRTISK